MPLAFLIGIHGFVWILPALVFGPQLLLRREPIVIPRSAIPLLLLVAWIPVTMLQLPLGKFPLATFRLLVFASTLVCLLWLVNETEERVSSARIVRLLSILWIVLIAFGYLAIALPHFSTPSPIQQVAPHALFSNSYIRDLGRWNFAQVQSLGTEQVGRPAAPMAYSNGWGSTLGLLTPFFVLDFFVLGSARRRRYGVAGRGHRSGADHHVAQPRPLAERRRRVRLRRAPARAAGKREARDRDRAGRPVHLRHARGHDLGQHGASAVRDREREQLGAQRALPGRVRRDEVTTIGRLRRPDRRWVVARCRHPRARLVRHGRVRLAGVHPARCCG